MPLNIPQQTLTSANYDQFGPNGLYSAGFLITTGGNVDVIITQTNTRGPASSGSSSSVLSPNLPPGQYTFSKGEGTFMTGIQVRPAAGVISSTPQTVQGTLYEPNASYILPVSTTNVSQNIGAAMVVIGKQVLSAAAASVTFNAIPQTYTTLKLFSCCGSDQVTDENVLVQLNGDAGAHYQYQLIYGTSATPTAAVNSAQTSFQIGTAPTAGLLGGIETTFQIYAAASSHVGFSTFESSGAASFAGVVGWVWTQVASIVSFTVFPSAGNFLSGSTFTLYGL